jgi:hypothetical protein
MRCCGPTLLVSSRPYCIFCCDACSGRSLNRSTRRRDYLYITRNHEFLHNPSPPSMSYRPATEGSLASSGQQTLDSASTPVPCSSLRLRA